MRETLRAWVDSIFSPAHTFLDMAIERLQSVQLVTQQGLNIGQHLAIFGDMPHEWQLVINSLLLSLVLIGSLFMFRALMRIYFAKKDGVKWW
ncbi:hypothetical protein [Desertibacillus haloalkaliphilus]|uniref:hypothetical protein n=1 Tax=Desertibacillus haloalkaliphilus TaxID=1328930 RepID=UPI001C25BF38|nr:hypothetical protein [Desertibacillus haloalkaliphilus]MBU8905578.1 hypothetical protein [Desertibacillus haloalkaliphilus]